MFFYDWTYLLIIPGMLLAVPVGAVVKILLTKTRKPKEEHNP